MRSKLAEIQREHIELHLLDETAPGPRPLPAELHSGYRVRP
jgi:hypothetical protein